MPFSLPRVSIKKSEKLGKSEEDVLKDMIGLVFRLLSCAYLETSLLTKKDSFIFGFTLLFDFKDGDIVCIDGELYTHLTPFAYRFGVLCDLVHSDKIDELQNEINKFPAIKLRKKYAFGTFFPYRISRTNPSQIFIELIKENFYTLKDNVSTSDLIYYFSGGVNGDVIIFDDQNNEKHAHKILRLMNETMDGFNLSEIWVNPENPEEWDFN